MFEKIQMGNNGLSIVGIALIVLGIIVAFISGILMQAEAKAFEFVRALSIYSIGLVIGVILLVTGSIILIFTSRS